MTKLTSLSSRSRRKFVWQTTPKTGVPAVRLDRSFGREQRGGKRPYATLDLKATEIKITPVPDNSQSQSNAHTAARGYPVPPTDTSPTADNTPCQPPASTYATHRSLRSRRMCKASDGKAPRQHRPRFRAGASSAAAAAVRRAIGLRRQACRRTPCKAGRRSS